MFDPKYVLATFRIVKKAIIEEKSYGRPVSVAKYGQCEHMFLYKVNKTLYHWKVYIVKGHNTTWVF